MADSLDAITTNRPYHRAKSLTFAYDEILECSGSLYDPSVVRAFQRAWELGTIQDIYNRWNANKESIEDG